MTSTTELLRAATVRRARPSLGPSRTSRLRRPGPGARHPAAPPAGRRLGARRRGGGRRRARVGSQGGSRSVRLGSDRSSHGLRRSPRRPDPMADGMVTTEEWHETVRSDAGVAAARSLRRGRRRLRLSATGRRRSPRPAETRGWRCGSAWAGGTPVDRTNWSCAAQERARPLLSCAEAHLDDGWLAVATTELAGATSGRRCAGVRHGTVVRERRRLLQPVRPRAGLGRHRAQRPGQPRGPGAGRPGVHAEFLEMVRVGVAWTARTSRASREPRRRARSGMAHVVA